MSRRLVPPLLVLWPLAAQAHLTTTGFEAYYNGIVHLMTSPAHLLAGVGVGLLAGLGGPTPARAARVLLPAAWLEGGLIGLAWPGGGEPSVALTVALVLIGALVALDAALSSGFVSTLAIAVGLLFGYATGAALPLGGEGGSVLLGAVSAVAALAVLSPILVAHLRVAWMRVAVRVMGSWIAAAGLLSLGWLARSTP